MTDYETLKNMLSEASIDFEDSESGDPRRHFIELFGSRVLFRFEPDDSLSEVYVLDPDEAVS